MKRRSCRRTKDEAWYHEKAVRLRKMTDEQLVNYVEDRVEKARSEGRNEMEKHLRGELEKAVKSRDRAVADFIRDLTKRSVKGIGAATIERLKGAAQEYGYI